MNRQRYAFPIRWCARLSSIAVIATLSLFLFGDNEDQSFQNRSEWAGFYLFPISVVVGMLLAWKWETTGAVLSMMGLCGFYLWHFSRSGNLPTGPWFIVFTIPALGFFLAGVLTRDWKCEP